MIKKLFIRLIVYYQNHAPARIRSACLFTPSCSNYMIMAINKYGLLRGLYKGLVRIAKCHPPNGGEDYP